MEGKITKQGIFVFAVSVIVSCAFGLFLYIEFLQPIGISFKRALAGGLALVLLSIAVYGLIQWVLRWNELALKTLGIWMFVSFALSPCFYPVPHYPAAPIFQSSSNIHIAVSIVDDAGEPVPLRGVWLRFDDKTYSYKDFEYSNSWKMAGERYFLAPGSSGELSWSGRIGERASLTIFPLDRNAQVVVVWNGEEFSSSLTDAPFIVNMKSAPPLWYYVLTVIARIICAGFLLFIFFSLFGFVLGAGSRKAVVIAVLACSSLYAIYAQFNNPEILGRLEIQIGRHDAVIAGAALDPWQYRVLAEWLIEGLLFLARQIGMSDPYPGVFAALRIAQNLVIFILAFRYFRKLGFSDILSLVGIVFLSGAALNSFHQSDLSFNTYFDAIFYLGAALLIMNDRFRWLPLLMLFASLNRETSGLIPLLALFCIVDFRASRAKLAAVIVSLFVWAGVFVTLRAVYPDRELFIPYGIHPGLELLAYNLTPQSLLLLLRFVSLAPLVGIVAFNRSPLTLKRFAIALIPVWVAAHFLGGVVSEARLFLVPQILVVIPLFLTFLRENPTFEQNRETLQSARQPLLAHA